jgi:hypothetical protein
LSIFAQLSFAAIKAKAIFDSNAAIHGLFPAGLEVPVLSPEAFPANPDHLLILSPVFHAEIMKSIWHKLGSATQIHIPLMGHYRKDEYPYKLV